MALLTSNTPILKTTETAQENLLATYQAIINSSKLLIEFEDNFINNYFSWNQDIIAFKLNNNQVSFCKSSSNFFTNNCQSLNIKTIIFKSDSLNHNDLILRARPSIDMACCYIFHHNPILHRDFKNIIINNKNFDVEDIKIFDNFEKARVIILTNNFFLGIVKNIINKIEDDILSADNSSLEIILLDQVFNTKLLPFSKNFVKNIRDQINDSIFQKIINLDNFVDSQEKFSKKVIEIIIEINALKQDLSNKDLDNEAESSMKSDNKNASDDSENFGAESVTNSLPQINQDEVSEKTPEEQNIPEIKDDKIYQEYNVESGADALIRDNSSYSNQIEFKNLYKIFTNKFDEIIYPKKFINKNELEILRDQLDLKITKLQSISKKITLKLKRKLLSKKINHLEIDNNFGVLNRKKLVNLILSPFIENIWVNHKAREYHDTVLTILIDNSGSMRGNPIVMSAMACEIIANILEKFAIKTEIIGYTTADWKGGKARKLWEINGRLKNPGRLNELRHIIYKSFSQSYRKSKNNLGLMLKEGILKENIDGEALLFARSRLMQQNSRRKILMVISDGTPVDDSTTTNNEGDILSDHLRHVINVIEKQGKIEIIGIGIGHATDDFYKNSIAIKTIDELGDAMIDKIIQLL